MSNSALRPRLIAVSIVLWLAGQNAFSQSSNPLPCTSPEYRQFDFWIGDWDVFELQSSTSTARVRVDPILGGCVLREHYEDNTGAVGESFSTYDPARKLWHQTWVTNRGRLLTIEGGQENGSMVLSGAYYRNNNQEVRVQGMWTPMGSSVRESAVMSLDAGKNWNPWFDLSFRRHLRGDDSTPQQEDQKAVAQLDEEFQAAVKANDAETMNKILADDFILVVGSGKVFNKQESLAEARSRTMRYEHQEDSERTVRVWGDTAVVTARLWIKGSRDGKPVDYTLWFSDTYMRRPEGWRYVFGQASLPLPKTP